MLSTALQLAGFGAAVACAFMVSAVVGVGVLAGSFLFLGYTLEGKGL